MKRLATSLTLLTMLSPQVYASDYKAMLKEWESFASRSKLGVSEDYWLEKKIQGYGWTKVAIIVGYGSDWSACTDIKTKLEGEYTATSYRCIPANK